jgi:hypothetical protein
MDDLQINFHRRRIVRWLLITYPYQTISSYVAFLSIAGYYALYKPIMKENLKLLDFKEKLYDQDNKACVVFKTDIK